jgi:hypothetical protein
VVEKLKVTRERPNDYVKRKGVAGTGNSCANSVAGVSVKTLGYAPACDCRTDVVRPCTVLDPFMGAATTAIVALQHGRRVWGIELSKEYLLNSAIPRIEGKLLDMGGEHLPKRKIEPCIIGGE